MKPRIWYDWDRMMWIAAWPFTLEASAIAVELNRRIRLKYVGAHQ